MTRKPKSNKNIIVLLLLVASIIALLYSIPNILSPASITAPSTCDFTILSIDNIQTLSNEPTLSNEKVYTLNIRADKGNECIKISLTQDDLTKYGIKDTLLGDLTITGYVEDMSLDYKIYDDAILYKIYESTASDDLSKPIPYNLVSLDTTKLSAINKFTDPNAQANTLSHLGNFPTGGDSNLMKDVGRWAYVMPEASNQPFGTDKTGNWWVTHMGGIPFYRGYLIDTMPFNKYTVQFNVQNEAGETLAYATADENNKILALSDFGRIKFTGSSIESVFPPQPGVDYAVVEGLEATPSEGKLKFVTKRRYSDYLNTLDELVNFDNNYFVYSWSDMKGSLMFNSTPVADVYIDNKYLGFTPLTVNDIDIGRHTITAKKQGYFDATQDINLVAAINKVNINLAKIPPPEIAISVSPTSIIEGSSATLNWAVTGQFNTIKLYDPNPTNVVSRSSKTVNPTQSTLYTIVAIGDGGDSTASTRLTVNPPPPLPPPPPVRRDPGVGREVITDKENTLNNMLGLMFNEKESPRDCILNSEAHVVTCRPIYPVAYPTFQIILKVSTVAVQLNSGIPEITTVTIPEIYEGTPNQLYVTIGNKGLMSDSFDLSLVSTPALSQGSQQYNIASKTTTSAIIPLSGPEGNYTAKIVLQSRNNPLAKATKTVNIVIKNKPYPDLTQLTPVIDEIIPPVTQNNTIQIIALAVIIATALIMIFRYKSKK